MSKVVGVLVYATGKTEQIENPTGVSYIKRCECCGSQLLFESTNGSFAEDQNTVIPGSESEGKLERIAKLSGRIFDGINRGCVVYIQRRG